jgi:hypothetical protein
VGKQSSISGSNTWYAGGGGGCSDGNSALGGDGGLGGGGKGRSNAANPPQDGDPNTGGGGGGCRDTYTANRAGKGGSGTVIVRYLQVPVTISMPGVTNLGATNVQYTTAVVQGQVTDIGGEMPNVWIHYWLDGSASTSTVAMGQQYSLFSTLLAGLTKGGTYQFLLMASNSAGTVWSDQKSFTTKSGLASYYVAPTNTGVSDGTSWATAFTNLQTAIDPCVAGDTVYIKGGTYPITNQVVWTQSGVTILGAYEGTNASGPGEFSVQRWPTALGRPGSAGPTRIMLVSGVTSGTLSRVSLTNGYLNTANVATGACLSVVGCSDLMLSSLTIAGGSANSAQPLVAGAGLFIGNSTNVILADSTVRDNTGACANNDYIRGSGIYLVNAQATITNCDIRNNMGGSRAGGAGTGALGHGLHVKNGRMTVTDSRIIGNFCSAANNHYSYGAGIYVDGGTNLFRNCLIAGNDNRGGQTYESQGDGAYLNAGVSTFVNCTFTRNNGQAIYYKAGAVTVTNSILWDNLDDLANFPTNSAGVLTNVWTSCVQNGDNNGVNGCLAADPLFERGLYLATNSPCVDKGGVTASESGVAGFTTRADGTLDTGNVDLGYHFPFGIETSAVSRLFVSPAGSDGNAGTNWATAFRSVTKALSLAEHGTHINVATGLYNTTVEQFPLTINRTFGLRLLGTNAAMTTLLGPAGENAMGMLIYGLSDVRIEGLTLANHGNHSADQAYTGGGASISHSRLSIGSCIFRDSSMNGYHSNTGPGAGLWAKDSFVTMTNCSVYGNSTPAGDSGGGIYALNGQLTLLDSLVSNNYASVAGGGLFLSGNRGGSGHVISHCLFVGNRMATSRGGAGLYSASTALVQNCVFVTNAIAGGTGAGIFVGGGYVTVKSCTLTRNHPEGIRQNTTNDSLAIRNTILWNNGDDLFSSNMTATLGNLWYSDIEDGDNVGTKGCISTDPLFANPTNDFHLKSKGGRWTPGDVWVKDPVTSPCIDAGDPAADYSREPEPNGNHVNMGAYGNTPQASMKWLMRGTVILIR